MEEKCLRVSVVKSVSMNGWAIPEFPTVFVDENWGGTARFLYTKLVFPTAVFSAPLKPVPKLLFTSAWRTKI